MKIIKNCETCKHLDYYHKDGYEDNSQEGYFCNKRSYLYPRDESEHLKKLEYESYRKHQKQCHDAVVSVMSQKILAEKKEVLEYLH